MNPPNKKTLVTQRPRRQLQINLNSPIYSTQQYVRLYVSHWIMVLVFGHLIETHSKYFVWLLTPIHHFVTNWLLFEDFFLFLFLQVLLRFRIKSFGFNCFVIKFYGFNLFDLISLFFIIFWEFFAFFFNLKTLLFLYLSQISLFSSKKKFISFLHSL